MKLSYTAVSITDGKKVEGLIEAKDTSQAAVYLRSKNLYPVRIARLKEGGFAKIQAYASKPKFADVVFFTRQLASVLTSGLTLIEALRILKEQTENTSMMEVIDGIVADIEDGKPFSAGLAKYPNVFFPVYVSLIKAAEASGLLEKVLVRLAENLEKEQRLKNTIRSALVYPAVIVVMMIAVLFAMMIFVIPQLSSLYVSLNVELPFVTKIVIGTSRFFILGWPFVVGILVIGVSFLNRWYQTEGGKYAIDKLSLVIPIFGKLIRQTILTEFSRTFGLMVGSGTSIVESLRKTAETSSNILYRSSISVISQQVAKGVSVGEAMALSPYLYPPILVAMAKIGEQTGKLDESLLRASDYFEREVDQTVKNLTTLLEPFILVVLGIGVAFLIIAIITPIYGLVSSIQ